MQQSPCGNSPQFGVWIGAGENLLLILPALFLFGCSVGLQAPVGDDVILQVPEEYAAYTTMIARPTNSFTLLYAFPNCG